MLRRIRRPEPVDPVRGWVALAALTAVQGAAVATAVLTRPAVGLALLVAATAVVGRSARAGAPLHRLRQASGGLRRQEERALAWAGVGDRCAARFVHRQTRALLVAGAFPSAALSVLAWWGTGLVQGLLPVVLVACSALVCWVAALLWVVGRRERRPGPE